MCSRPDTATITPGQVVDNKSAWKAADYPDDRSWVRPIPDVVIDEIDAAVPGLRDSGLKPQDFRAAHFPMPRSADWLAEIERELETESGFALLSGFPIERYDDQDRVLAYGGLMAQFGDITIQSRAHEYVVDVSDKGKGLGAKARGHYGNNQLPFHADGANMVSLLCLETAPEGGRSLIVSGAEIYNEVVRNHPEFLPVLERGFHHHRREERGPDDPTYTAWRTPVFAYYDNRFHIVYVRISIDYCAEEGVTITADETAAMDYLDQVMFRPDMAVSMALQPGDLQILNNFLVLHSRTAYIDHPEHKRHLIRLWLDQPDSLRNGPSKMDWYMPEHSRFLKARGHLLEGYHPPVNTAADAAE